MRNSRPLLVLGLLATSLVWSCWPTLIAMGEKWAHDPKYSHAFIVPMIVGLILWSRRELRPLDELRPSWWGVAWVAGGAAMQLLGTRYYIPWLTGMSLLPYAAGLIVLAGGRPALRWAWPGVLFLAFVVPLPYRVEVAMGFPLQRTAAVASAYVLQTLGLPALAEGTVIHIDDHRLGVEEACNGLAMLMSFVAIAAAVALLIDRPRSHRAVVVLSAIPIAIVANIARITATAYVYRALGKQWSHLVFHDLAGWLMMPLRVGAFAPGTDGAGAASGTNHRVATDAAAARE